MEYAVIKLKEEKQLLEDTIELNIYFSKEMINIKKQMLADVNKALNILSGATVKLREECFLKTQHDDMKSANWKYCSQCGVKL
jgi:hypothetical protein